MHVHHAAQAKAAAIEHPRRKSALPLLESAERTSEEHERITGARDAHVVDPPNDDPVVAGWVLGYDLALE
jgi:hypothetical protein